MKDGFMPGCGTHVVDCMHRGGARDAGLCTNHRKYAHICPILVHAARHVELGGEFETAHGDARRALVALHGARAQQVAEGDAKGNFVHGRSHARVRGSGVRKIVLFGALLVLCMFLMRLNVCRQSIDSTFNSADTARTRALPALLCTG